MLCACGVALTTMIALAAVLAPVLHRAPYPRGLLNLTRVCAGSVAVVGNGPLDAGDRMRINGGYDCVVRFNDMKNAKPGDYLSVHVIRDTMSRVYPLPAKVRKFPAAPYSLENGVYVQPVTARPRMLNRIASIPNLLTPIFVYERDGDVADEVYFKGCRHCGEAYNCSSSSGKCGASTGTAIIHRLAVSNHVHRIHIFGMNWMGGGHHFDFRQPTLVRDCCKKCTIHTTSSRSYV